MNKLAIKQRRSSFQSDYFYDDLTIDDEYLDVILAKYDINNFSDIGIKDLAFASNLYDKDETILLWHYIGQLNEGNHGFVPVLVCPDDMDLTCIVIVAEQLVKDNQVHWLRFGLLLGDFIEQDENGIHWLNNSPYFIFSRQNFIETYHVFLEQAKAYWASYGDTINIKIPADPPKEDWELIIDSWYD